MSLWNDFVNFVEDTADSIGDAVQSAWDAVKSNPIGAITSAVAMAYGIPPTWAGALGGAAGAAATGGNVVKAAITGGAMGYMGSAAGAAAGSAGPIAAAAASGAAAGVTGAVLTGQDVVTAMKQGLILGTVAGGVQQFMTPQEAISKVPTDAIARANASADPIGTLSKEMGWYDSVSATNAASQAIQNAKSDGSLRQYYGDQIPDDVLAKAMKTANPAASVAKDMGWSMSGPQVGGIYDALNDYKMASTPAVAPGTGTGANSLITPTNPTGAPGPGAPVYDATPSPVTPQAPQVSDLWSNFSQTDTFDPATATSADITKNSATYAQQELKAMYGNQVNNGVLQNIENPTSFYARNLAAAEASGNPEAYLKSVGYNQSTVDQLMDYYDAKQYAQQQYAQEQTQYAQAHQVDTGVVSDAGTGEVPFRVEASGTPKFAGMSGAGTPPAGYTVATPEQIWGPNDTGTASNPYTQGSYYDAQSNTWYAPKQVAATTPTPVTPIIVPPTPTVTQPSTPVAPVTNTTQPTTTTTGTGTGSVAQPVTTQPQPVQPTTPTVTQPQPVTTVSSSTRTTQDGSVYKDEQKSDGTVVTTLISGPTGTGTTTGTGAGGTTIGPISSGGTTNPNPPLTPPGQEVIPPGSSYVAPVETGTTTTPTDTTTTPTDTTTPIVPIVTPTDPNNPTGTYHYGTYTLGKGNKVNVPTGLNPGWMAPTPQYQTTSPEQAQYYWGSHPYQPGPEFNAQLYNNVPAAPSQPWGSQHVQTAATPQQILQAMGMYYPLIGSSNTVAGAVRP